ncbi:glycoside hydrolase family 6 protein [Kineococcus radiotolerans]|uniref:Glucanase n=1 Tax=Kineococcus radiotolerans (strain ATCC BAA-149 / DSM 14245 / SRS30216) TaxID=266940 RepID=A6WGZ2_KINRD|nr:glycoside hydrolase family 6 protein [Kineococcus radiotolerans]ABS06081.1 Cellulase [Kineococcus radiotolerans SRS30216 = ATCC BAA-149]
MTSSTAPSSRPSPRYRRSLALAAALAAGGALLAPLPAQAAAGAAPAPTSSASPTESEDPASIDPDARTPKAADPADQDEVDSLWEKLKRWVTGVGESNEATEDEGREDQDQPHPSTTTGKDAAALPAGANNTVLTAGGFVNSIGVGMHVAYLDRAYGDVDSVKLAEDLGVKHVRDGLGSTDSVPLESMKRLSEAGISINWVAQPETSSFTIENQLQLIKDNDLNVTSVEGVNERDNAGVSDWAGKVRAHQRELYTAVKDTLGEDVAVVAPSLVFDESRAELGEVPSDIANSHPYTGGAMQTAEHTEHQVQMAAEVTPGVDTSTPQAADARTTLSSAVEDGGAMWATELGFHTATDSTAGNGVQPHVSEDAQAVLQLQQLLANFQNGVDRSYIYELLDEGSNNAEAEDRFGLYHSDGSPKPVATALKNLIATVEHGGPSATGSASPAEVEVNGGSDDTTTLVLPRADGSTVVAVWEAAPVWDQDGEKPLDVPDREVTLDVGEDVDAQVFVPGQSAKALDSEKGVSTLNLTSQAAPTIVVLAPTGGTDDAAQSPEDEADGETAAENADADTRTDTGGEAAEEETGAGGNPFAAAAPYADPSYAAQEIDDVRGSDPDAAQALERIAKGGVALWVGDWTRDVTATVRDYATAAQKAGKTAVVVTYAAPGRDCGSYSAGGLSPQEYPGWVEQVADGLRGTGAAVIVEPDAIAQVGQCDGQGDRLALLRKAVQVLDEAGAAVYLDAGNSSWTGGQVDTIAQRLRKAGVDQARGFATNVSNFNADAAERSYAEALSKELDGAHYVVDTSRNGSGGNGEWCNPEGRTLGKTPAAVDDDSHQDARLWIKRVGESDGTCNGGPAAGTFWVEQAVELAQST